MKLLDVLKGLLVPVVRLPDGDDESGEKAPCQSDHYDEEGAGLSVSPPGEVEKHRGVAPDRPALGQPSGMTAQRKLPAGLSRRWEKKRRRRL
ncbi:MAG TPA: hypothetical protein VI248_28760 [Kineosporiaceae bacterium]